MRSPWPLVFGLVAACGGILREEDPGASDLFAELEPPVCADPVTATDDGHHRPGDDCMSCHRQGGDATPYTFAGTLYADPGGTTPAAGVTMHLMDAVGGDAVVVTAANGNFWSFDPLTPPLVAFVARCPDVVPMLTPIAETDLGCNRAGCHTSGFRVHP